MSSPPFTATDLQEPYDLAVKLRSSLAFCEPEPGGQADREHLSIFDAVDDIVSRIDNLSRMLRP